jgi:flagellum-specific peptidoglycan hydrolase FlgJ
VKDGKATFCPDSTHELAGKTADIPDMTIMNQAQKQFLDAAATQAVKANHPFAQMAACEAALESTWGHSELAREANNLFGMKQHSHPIYGTMSLPTREWAVPSGDTHKIDGRWIVVNANWVKYPDWRACFCDRLATLERLSNAYPHYKAALEAKDARTYIISVSESWSTDPERALHVQGIYEEYIALAVPPAASPAPAAAPTEPD